MKTCDYDIRGNKFCLIEERIFILLRISHSDFVKVLLIFVQDLEENPKLTANIFLLRLLCLKFVMPLSISFATINLGKNYSN